MSIQSLASEKRRVTFYQVINIINKNVACHKVTRHEPTRLNAIWLVSALLTKVQFLKSKAQIDLCDVLAYERTLVT